MEKLNLIITQRVMKLLTKVSLLQVPQQALQHMGHHQISIIHQSQEVQDNWIKLFHIQTSGQQLILVPLKLGNLGQQESIGLQNFTQQYGKKMLPLVIGIPHQIGQQVMCQLLMFMLSLQQEQHVTLKFQIQVPYQKILL